MGDFDGVYCAVGNDFGVVVYILGGVIGIDGGGGGGKLGGAGGEETWLESRRSHCDELVIDVQHEVGLKVPHIEVGRL